MPNNFEPGSKLLRTLALCQYRQPVWGTPLTVASLTRVQRFDGSAVLDFEIGRRSDKEMSGKGSWFATNGQITDIHTKLSGLKAELSPWLAGFLLGFGLGKDVVTGSASPYAHTFSFDFSTRQAVPTTVYLQDTTDLAYLVQDMAVTDFTLTIPDKGAVTADWNMMGTGRYTPGALSTPPSIPAENYLLGSDANVLWGPVGAPLSLLGRFMGATLKVDHQMVEHRALGGGLTGFFIRKGDPKFSLSLTIAAQTPDDIFTRYINNTQTAISIPINSGAANSLTINVPAANLKTNKMGFDADMTIWNVELDETTCYQLAGVQPITFTLSSADPTWLTVGT